MTFNRLVTHFALFALVVVVLGTTTGCAKKGFVSALGQMQSVSATVALDPPAHRLNATTTVKWNAVKADTFFFFLNSNLTIKSVQATGGDVGDLITLGKGKAIASILARITGEPEDGNPPEHLTLHALPVQADGDSVALIFSYSGEIYDEVKTASFSRWEIADETTGLISEQGAFLTSWSGWYPQLPIRNDPIPFRSMIATPSNWKSVAEGKVMHSDSTYTVFDSENPIDGQTIVAGPYLMKTLPNSSPEIAMYYYANSEDLVDKYLQATQRYFEMYDTLLGEYAYSRFSVVENFFPTGYGMPTFTLLGSQVIRLPFIIATSLGHEICHNWWGNGVFVDYSSGNWCEGLTTFCADYTYKEKSDPAGARAYRMDISREYSDYVVRGSDEDFPLRAFTSRTTAGSRTIGYGKSMMIYHMMRNRIGEQAFWKSLREVYEQKKFQYAKWEDFFDTFGKNGNEDLSWMMKQWLDQTGAPQLVVDSVSVAPDGGNWVLTFTLKQAQSGKPYQLDVPYQITFADGSTTKEWVKDMKGSVQRCTVRTGKEPIGLQIDPDFDLFRVLDPKEAPATLSGFLAEEKPVIVVPDGDDSLAIAYQAVANGFNRKGGATIIKQSQVTPELIADKSVLYLGKQDKLTISDSAVEIDGQKATGNDLAAVYVWRDPVYTQRVHLAIWGTTPASLTPIANKLQHYGKYSYLGFDAGTNKLKGHFPANDSPLRVKIK